ncbi:MAG: hypothetical protein ACOCP4_00830 [Candidatus Woesearchaeota archaeon]
MTTKEKIKTAILYMIQGIHINQFILSTELYTLKLTENTTFYDISKEKNIKKLMKRKKAYERGIIKLINRL